jgi:acyl carrier protein
LPNLLLTIRGADLRESREYLKNERINLTNSHILNQAKLVSSPEGLMPALTYAGFRDIDYFPIGLGYNDVVFVPYVDNSFEEVEISLYGQVPAVDRGEWSSIISAILKEKYNQVFIDSFSVTIDQLNENLVYQSVQQWDSIGHMGMVAALEEAFDIMMETDDIIDFGSYAKGIEILAKYNLFLPLQIVSIKGLSEG